MNRIAILASGSGTNAINLFQHSLKMKNVEIATIITDNPRAGVIAKFKEFDINVTIIEYQKNKVFLENDILSELKRLKVDWVLLAGYMRILGPEFLSNFYDPNLDVNRVINIHPSYLPEYPGLHSFKRAFNDERPYSGITIHFVDEGVDTGPIIIQEKFFRNANDDLESFSKRGHELEYELYPKVMKYINDGQLGHHLRSHI